MEIKKNQNQTSGQTNEQTTASTTIYFSVNNIGNSPGKNEFVDFSWSENNHEKKLSDFKGKVIVLNFWATWCPPCRKEIPALSEIASDYKDEDFEIIGISVDQNPQALANFLKANFIPYKVLHEPGGLLEKYMAIAGQNDGVIPQTYVINKKGKIVETIIGSRSKQAFTDIIKKYM
jgi:thiol-disulfide isomerase/thioredoxin